MGTLFENLPNKSELMQWITTYGGFNDSNYSEPTVSLQLLMRFWEKNKAQLYKMLDNQYIYEKEVQYEKPVSLLEDEMFDFLTRSEEGSTFKSIFKDWVFNWIEEDCVERNQYYGKLVGLVSSYSLATNVYPDRTFKINVNGNDIPISHNSKISKILSKIAKAANLDGFENFRIGHSRVLNQKKITGTLCFSIHPLDYFTMSDNEYGWDSCMNWRDAGCYRLGTVEMCNSPYVIVCYLKGDKQLRFYDNYWNSKKWRNLFIIDKDLITGVKGYPYQDEVLDTLCINTLKELAEKNLNWKFNDTIHEHCFDNESDTVYLNNNEDKYYFSFSTEHMYNDFSNHAIAHFVLSPEAPSDIYINYSGPAVCMCCGSQIYDNVSGDDCVLCDDCASAIYCECCDSRIRSDNDVYELDDMLLCESCYFDNRVIDPITQEEHHIDNCTQIYLIPNEEEIIDNYYEFVENHKFIRVYNRYSNDFEEYFGRCHTLSLTRKSSIYNWTDTVYVVYESECSPEGKAIFSDYGEWD